MYRDVEATVKAKQRKRFREALKQKKREEAAQEVCLPSNVCLRHCPFRAMLVKGRLPCDVLDRVVGGLSGLCR